MINLIEKIKKFIFNFSTPIFYINLRDDTKRNNSMISSIRTYKFKNITRIEAIDTRKNIENYTKFFDPICL